MTAIALGADHAGFALKEELKRWLEAHGHEVLDVGADSAASVDYPDFAIAVAAEIRRGRARAGVLVCGTGIGMAITANKIPGIRAANCTDAYAARMSREHNDANVLTLGSRLTAREAAIEILEQWLAAGFAGGRHARRVAKMAELDGTAVREAADVTAR